MSRDVLKIENIVKVLAPKDYYERIDIDFKSNQEGIEIIKLYANERESESNGVYVIFGKINTVSDGENKITSKKPEEEKVIYIGKSKVLWDRIEKHLSYTKNSSKTNFIKNILQHRYEYVDCLAKYEENQHTDRVVVSSISIFLFDNGDSGKDLFELLLIAAYKPPFNKEYVNKINDIDDEDSNTEDESSEYVYASSEELEEDGLTTIWYKSELSRNLK